MSEDFTRTVRIQRASRVAPDDRGRNVWVGKVETVELELVSTMALKKILQTADGQTRAEIRELAKGSKDGVLARDTATGHYQIVSEGELKAIADSDSGPKPLAADRPTRGADVVAAPLTDKARLAAAELSLVSTQFLRKVVNKKDPSGGFNPYDKG